MVKGKRILVTGGAGFIGSNLVRALLGDPSGTEAERVVVFDKLTYAGRRENLDECLGDTRFCFVEGDISDVSRVSEVLREEAISAVIHLAAESHVDRSIEAAGNFIETNIVGTFQLLEAIRRFLEGGGVRDEFRFVHVSTDEVFGALSATEEPFSEDSRYAPNSPYSASKAASDHLVRAWGKTYRLPVITVNSSNVYGPFQFPEKLIPLMIERARSGRSLPVYGDGSQRRDWIHVADHCQALVAAMVRGAVGESYAIGGGEELSNLELVTRINALVCEMTGAKGEIEHVEDRPAHDWRYAINSAKAEADLGWMPKRSFDEGLRETVRWYLDHPDWVDRAMKRGYDGGRLGLTDSG